MSRSSLFPESTSERSARIPARFVVGQDIAGRWVALEVRGRGGGLFRSRRDAIHYALKRTIGRPDAVTLATEPVELRM